MSEPVAKSGGGALKGIAIGIGLCSVLTVVASLLFPLAPPPGPTVSNSPSQDIASAGQGDDTTDTLVAPATDAPREGEIVDIVPVAPVSDRDSSMAQAELATQPLENTVAPEVAALADELPVDGRPNLPEFETSGAPVSLIPELPETNLAISNAPMVIEDHDLALQAPPVNDAAEPQVPAVQSVAVATLAIDPPEVSDVDDEAPDLGLAREDDLVTQVLQDTPPTAESQDAAPDVTVSDLAPQVDPVAPKVTLPTAPDGTSGIALAAAIPAPHADNPVSRADADDQSAALVPQPEKAAGPAFSVHANQEFVAAPNKPMLAIVIEDVGDDGVSATALAELSLPLTVAVSPGNPSLGLYRESGFELVARLANEDGSPIAASVAPGEFSAQVTALREELNQTVAMSEVHASDLYRKPKLLRDVAGDLAATGHAVLIFERFGSGAAINTLRDAGVRTGTITRMIPRTANAQETRRALDRAALEASKTGTAILYAYSTGDTVAALVPWLLGNSARSIQIAPLTTTILGVDPD